MTTIDTRFPSSNLASWQEEDGIISLEPKGGAAQPWFYFLITGAAGQELTFSVPALADQQGWSASISYDRVDWVSADVAGPGATFKHRFLRDDAIVSLTPPYTNGMLWELFFWSQRSPHMDVDFLGKSAQSGTEPVTLFTISDMGKRENNPVVWLIAREHPLETATSWLAEGCIRFLISTDPLAQALRQRFTFKIVPMLDYIGVFNSALNPTVSWDEAGSAAVAGGDAASDEADASPTALISRLLAADFQSTAGISLALLLRSSMLGSVGSCKLPMGVTWATATADWRRQAMAILPWYDWATITAASTTTDGAGAIAGAFGKHMAQLCPGATVGEVTTSWYYGANSIGNAIDEHKSQYDMLQEGELLWRALSGAMGDFSEVNGAGLPALLLPRLAFAGDKAEASVLYRPAGDEQVYLAGQDYEQVMTASGEQGGQGEQGKQSEQQGGYIRYTVVVPIQEAEKAQYIEARGSETIPSGRVKFGGGSGAVGGVRDGARRIPLAERRDRPADASLSL